MSEMRVANDALEERLVAVVRTASASYGSPPFSPAARFPEFESLRKHGGDVNPSNSLYGDVRHLLYALGLDPENFGTARWNPFSRFVKPGQNTVIKPNLVSDSHPDGESGVLGIVTHASVIRPIIDYVVLATGGEGRITVCDVPLDSANWDRLVAANGLRQLVDYYRGLGIDVELLDCRREGVLLNRQGVIYGRIPLLGDPRGYTVVDLGQRSALFPIRALNTRLEITDYGYGSVPRHHHDSVNEYYIAKTVLEADFFVNVPKVKTHRKAGVTLALKNLVGINGDKSWIAHHRRGLPENGGDEFPNISPVHLLSWRLYNYLKSKGRTGVSLASLMRAVERRLTGHGSACPGQGRTETIFEGSWHGNDTVWRTILDLNLILRYADKDGVLQSEPARQYLAICDGVIAADLEGPLEGRPVNAHLIAAGLNPVATDLVVSHLMGFDWRRIPQIAKAFELPEPGIVRFAPENVEVCGSYDTQTWQKENLGFRPPAGWASHIERQT